VAGAVGINLGTQLMRCSSCDHHAQVEVNKYVNEDPITLEMGADCPRCKAKNTVGVSDDHTGEAFETKMKDVCSKIRLFKNYNGRILVVRPGGDRYFL